MAEPVVHHHYHYHYFYNAPVPEVAAAPEPRGAVPEPGGDNENYPESDSASLHSSHSSSSTPIFMPPGSATPHAAYYIRQGIEILDKDKGILSSYGYYNVRDQTQKHRRLVLTEATQYIAKEYIQERLYYIASVQPENEWNPYEEDLVWFERAFQLPPYRLDPDA